MRPLVLLLMAYCVSAQAQELVPNGDLEQFGTCPDNLTQIDLASGWSRPTQGSSDYLNACSSFPNIVSVPHSGFGYQVAHSGNGYAGILCFAGPDANLEQDIHEYVSHALAAPLVPGETYSVTYFVNLTEFSRYALNDIGALFSVQEPHRDDMRALTATPQITNSTLAMLADTSDWMRIQGCFTADSAYTYITIGNFHPGANTTYADMPPPWSGVPVSYYFVDDVSVVHVPRPELGPDLTFCEAATFAVQDPIPGATYLWSTGEIGPSITVDAAGTYSVISEDDACPLSDTVVVHLGTPITLGLSTDTLVDLCVAQSVLLDARPEPLDAELTWSTGESTTTIVVNVAGTYLVYANAADHCATSATITVNNTCEPLFAPNAFTPNGDGINDQWRPILNANTDATFEWSIYDRWGHVLFNSTGKDDAWDGTAAGMLVPNGLYDWRGRVRDPDTGLVRELTGHVLLLR